MLGSWGFPDTRYLTIDNNFSPSVGAGSASGDWAWVRIFTDLGPVDEV